MHFLLAAPRSQHPILRPSDGGANSKRSADLKLLSPYSSGIRTSFRPASGELVPEIAAEFGLKVTLASDRRRSPNERENQVGDRPCAPLQHITLSWSAMKPPARGEVDRPSVSWLKFQRVNGKVLWPVTTARSGRMDRAIRSLRPQSTSSPRISSLLGRIHHDAAVDKTIEFYTKRRRAHPGTRIVMPSSSGPSAGPPTFATPEPRTDRGRRACCASSCFPFEAYGNRLQ